MFVTVTHHHYEWEKIVQYLMTWVGLFGWYPCGEKPIANSICQVADSTTKLQLLHFLTFIFPVQCFEAIKMHEKKHDPAILPEVLKRLTLLLWQIAGPLSWLVSIVVTFVLIPAAYANEPAKVEPCSSCPVMSSWFSWRKFQRWFYKRRFFFRVVDVWKQWLYVECVI